MEEDTIREKTNGVGGSGGVRHGKALGIYGLADFVCSSSSGIDATAMGFLARGIHDIAWMARGGGLSATWGSCGFISFRLRSS